MRVISTRMESTSRGALSGVRVLELGQLVAAPYAGTILGYFGAEVIKVESPGAGDPLRNWRGLEQGTSLWWRSMSRNKRCITVDLRTDEGRSLVRRLAANVDVLIENFRPGTLEEWGLAPDLLREQNPRLIVARVSGFGQTGPSKDRPGFASVCEAMGGLRYVNGHAGEIPVRANLSIGDTLAGLHTAMGVLLALYERDAFRAPTATREGQTIDTAITESVFSMMEAAYTEYDRLGIVREPSGTTITGVVPTNTYRCNDDVCVVIGGTGDPVFRRLMHAIGRADFASDSRFATNALRVEHTALLDETISSWCRLHSSVDVINTLEHAEVPVGRIQSIADIAGDPQFIAREAFEPVSSDLGTIRIPAIAPKLSRTPGSSRTAGPSLGAHTREVLQQELGLRDDELDALHTRGII